MKDYKTRLGLTMRERAEQKEMDYEKLKQADARLQKMSTKITDSFVEFEQEYPKKGELEAEVARKQVIVSEYVSSVPKSYKYLADKGLIDVRTDIVEFKSAERRFAEAYTFDNEGSHSLGLGEYGKDFTEAMMKANVYLQRVLKAMDQKGHLRSIEKEYSDMIGEYTFYDNTYSMFADNVGSTMAVFGLLMGKKVEGFEDDPVGCMRAMINDRVISTISAVLPNGVIGPFHMENLYFVDPLKSKDGHFRASDNLVEVARLTKDRSEMAREVGPQERIVGDGPSTGIGCPARKGAVDKLANLYVDYVEKFYKREVEK